MLTLHEAIEQSAFIADTDGKFYRVDSYDPYNATVCFHQEDSGEEFQYDISDLKGWKFFRLQEIV